MGARSELEKEKINISSSPSVLTAVRQVKLYLIVRVVSLEWIRFWKK